MNKTQLILAAAFWLRMAAEMPLTQWLEVVQHARVRVGRPA